MKQSLIFAFCLTILSSIAGEVEKTIKTKPEKIIVYTQGVQIH